MDNSSNSDEIKPFELTELEINDLQILLNKLWNLQNLIDNFNSNIDKMFQDFQYILKSIDPTIDMETYFNNQKINTASFRSSLIASSYEFRKKIKVYTDKLKLHELNSSWEHDWIKENVVVKELPEDVINRLKNYFANLSSFNLPSCLVSGHSDRFFESVLGSEPLFIYFRPEEKAMVHSIMAKMSETQKARLRLYDATWNLPKGLMANVIAWDYIHLIDTNRFEKETIGFLYGMLRPGGLLTFNYPSIYDPIDFNYMIRHNFGIYDPDFLEDIVKKTGFEIVNHDEVNQIFYLKKPGILNINKASPTISTVVNIDSLFDKK